MPKEGNLPDEDLDKLSTIPHERKGERPDFSQPLPRKQLPAELQKQLDSEESWWNVVSSGDAGESTESNVRYAAYAARFRTILLSAHRYVAYTSDIGESFRPIAHPLLVRGAYGISWAYLIGDVSHESYKAYKHNQRILNPQNEEDQQFAAAHPGQTIPAIERPWAVGAQRAVFQSVASMGLPAFTIHSIVRYSGQALKKAKNPTIRTWGPIGLGLAAVPALPFMFDKPVEHATEWIFHQAFLMVGGPTAVGQDEQGRGPGLQIKQKEKEL